jgi:polysaccharide pyruvyl transferase CsaB
LTAPSGVPSEAGRVLIAGSYGQGNTGDEAILAALLAGLRARRPGLHLQVVSGDAAATAAQHGVEALYWGDWAGIAEALDAADLLILGGGGIFFDYWGFDPRRLLENEAPDLAHYASFPLLAGLAGRPLLICAVGVGPLFTPEGREAVRLAFALAARASVRDTGSKALLEEIGVPGGRVEVTADPAFSLVPAGEARAKELLAGLGLGERPLLGVTPRPWDVAVSQEAWETGLAAALAGFAQPAGAQILLIPFHAGYDDASLERLREKLRAAGMSAGMSAGDVRILPPGCSPQEIAAVIGRCDLLVGLRLHSILFALLSGTPAVALAYDPKVRSLARLAGHEELCLDLSDLSGLEDALAGAWARRGELRRDFLATAARLKRDAGRNVDLALELLDGAPGVSGPPALSREDQEAFRRLAGQALGGRLRDVARRDGVIRERGATIERQWTEMEQYRTWLRTQQQATEEQRQGREQAERELEEVRRQKESALRQGDVLLAERNDLDRRLTAFERTLAYRIVSRFWRLMRRAFPEGSRRHRLYRLGRRALGKLVRAGDPAGPQAAWREGTGGAPAPLSPDAPAPEPPPDFRADLLRFEERVRAAGASQVVAIFSGTQLLESEGQRPTQLALALAARGVPVVFVYWRWWDNEWRPQDRLEEGIVQVPIDVVTRRPEILTGAFAGRERIALFEFPHPGFFETVSAAGSAGWITVYDVIDDWEEFHRVGQAAWWDGEFERHLLGACDALFCINGFLRDRIGELVGLVGKAELVGNGLKPGLGEIRQSRPLARGEVTVGYFGYLAGAWFDWELIAEAARRRPAWRFYLIGYGGGPEGKGETVELPANVELLGKQPQEDLAAFAANWDAALIPFKPDRLAAGADPIKAYEYLAMGLPVVTTGVYPPAGGEAFVTRAEGVEELLAAVERAAAAGGPEAPAATARRAFAAGCTWEHRLEAMLGSIAAGRQRVAEKRALFSSNTGGRP